jgi:HSP20 family protein
MRTLSVPRRRDRTLLTSWADLDLLEDRLGRLFQGLPVPGASGGPLVWAPRIDVVEEHGRFVLTAELPGIDPHDVEIEVEGRVLSIKGEKRVEREEGDERIRIAERREGAFDRTFTLPPSANAEKVTAGFHQGVLTLAIEKQPEAKGRKIPVRTG